MKWRHIYLYFCCYIVALFQHIYMGKSFWMLVCACACMVYIGFSLSPLLLYFKWFSTVFSQLLLSRTISATVPNYTHSHTPDTDDVFIVRSKNYVKFSLLLNIVSVKLKPLWFIFKKFFTRSFHLWFSRSPRYMYVWLIVRKPLNKIYNNGFFNRIPSNGMFFRRSLSLKSIGSFRQLRNKSAKR